MTGWEPVFQVGGYGGDYFMERNGTEQNGMELWSKIRSGTGLKCETAKSRNMEGGAVSAST